MTLQSCFAAISRRFSSLLFTAISAMAVCQTINSTSPKTGVPAHSRTMPSTSSSGSIRIPAISSQRTPLPVQKGGQSVSPQRTQVLQDSPPHLFDVPVHNGKPLTTPISGSAGNSVRGLPSQSVLQGSSPHLFDVPVHNEKPVTTPIPGSAGNSVGGLLSQPVLQGSSPRLFDVPATNRKPLTAVRAESANRAATYSPAPRVESSGLANKVMPMTATPAAKSEPVFVDGNCTKYAQGVFNSIAPSHLNWHGNAGQWYDNAANAGWKTTTAVSDIPKNSTVLMIWTGGPTTFGHVAACKRLADQLQCSEMNYKGLGIVSQATLPITGSLNRGSLKFKGFILPEQKGN